MNQPYLCVSTGGLEKNILYCLKADAVNIAAFLVRNQEAPFISMDTLDDFPFLTARYGFVDKCYDQEYLIRELLPVLIPLQMKETGLSELVILTDETDIVMDKLPRPDWNCLKDYGVSDNEYEEFFEQADNSIEPDCDL